MATTSLLDHVDRPLVLGEIPSQLKKITTGRKARLDASKTTGVCRRAHSESRA